MSNIYNLEPPTKGKVCVCNLHGYHYRMDLSREPGAVMHSAMQCGCCAAVPESTATTTTTTINTNCIIR